MSPENPILLQLLASREASLKHLEALRSVPAPSRQTVREHIRSYVFLRYLLREEEHPDATFEELTQRSIAHTARIAPELVRELDTTKDCMGSTSVMAKKVLLLRGIEKNLSITLPAVASARVVTLDDLGDLVWESLNPPSDS